MARGKFQKKRRKVLSKGATMLLAVALLLTFAAGGTVAYLAVSGGSVSNTFEAGVVNCTVNSNGTVTNGSGSNVPAYIRAYAVANWVDSEGSIYAGTASCTLSGSNWQAGSDGFYYYLSPVDPDHSTSVLTASPSGTAPEGVTCTLDVVIVAEAIQAEGGAVSNAWPGAPSLDN